MIARSRADDAVIGVRRQRIVAVGRGERRGIGVARGAVEQDARRLHGGIITVQRGARFFLGKAAGGAEGHIDHVHAQHDGVVQCRQDDVGVSAAGVVGEHLEDGQLRLGRFAGKGDVAVCVDGLAGGGAGDMGAVVVAVIGHRACRRDDVRIYVGIVKGEGHLRADIQLVRRQLVAVVVGRPQRGVGVRQQSAVRVGGVKELFQILFGQARLLRVVGKGLMRPVQTGVQNADDDALALIGRTVGKVLHGLRRLRGGIRDVGVPFFAEADACDAVHRLNGCDLAVGHDGGKAAGDRGVGVFRLGMDAGCVHLAQHLRLHRADDAELLLRLRRGQVIRDGHAVGPGVLLPGLDQTFRVQLDDNAHRFVRLRQIDLREPVGVCVGGEPLEALLGADLIGHIAHDCGVGGRFGRVCGRGGHGLRRQHGDEHHQRQKKRAKAASVVGLASSHVQSSSLWVDPVAAQKNVCSPRRASGLFHYRPACRK